MDEHVNPDTEAPARHDADDEDASRRMICVDHTGQPIYDDEIPTGTEESFLRDCRDAEHPRRLAHWLKFMRKELGNSKDCIAMQMGSSVRAITDMEKAEDSELRFVDVARYLEAIGAGCTLRVRDFTLHGQERERRLIIDAARSLSALRECFADREERVLTRDLDRFLGETLTKLLLAVHDEAVEQQEIFVCGMRIERVPYYH
ncbi:MAG: hypothetical protein M5R41_07805 [Bacteroidia bacterium]|nr:hypothetical protein [Bacteroidia bacterium]